MLNMQLRKTRHERAKNLIASTHLHWMASKFNKLNIWEEEKSLAKLCIKLRLILIKFRLLKLLKTFLTNVTKTSSIRYRQISKTLNRWFKISISKTYLMVQINLSSNQRKNRKTKSQLLLETKFTKRVRRKSQC